ncbi:PAS domain S-box-containing protein [Allopseudospirillum japonicum]|uniref:histidine kinase n=1 Tax=Allopseudospirillum japonicum TaxID=64971 RepID=A0A1H6SJ89_9GAMM|nr:ATP-binding protein [Allopseudospirillum japonicum]SEI63845.1 PAS domain S-box-containing protein [Allopseudospirillum japonicum]
MKYAYFNQLSLKSLFHDVDTLVIATDKRLNIIYVNPAYCTATGYTCEEIYQHPAHFWLAQVRSDQSFPIIFKSIHRHQIWQGQLTGQRKDTSLWHQSTSIKKLLDSQGHHLGYISIGQDISSRLLFEKNTNRLGRLEALGHLLAGLTHEFNNLFGTINGLTELNLALSQPQDPLYKNLQQTLCAGTRAARLLEHLDILNPDNQKTPNTKIKNLNQLVYKTQAIVQDMLGEEIHFSMNLHQHSLPVSLDAHGFIQVLVNLVRNAKDALASQNLPKFIISTQIKTFNFIETHQSKNYAVISFYDNGSGICPEIQTRIFDPFFTTKDIGKGTGLGMSLVNQFVTLHQGLIEIDSRPNKYTDIRLLFPLQRQDNVANT